MNRTQVKFTSLSSIQGEPSMIHIEYWIEVTDRYRRAIMLYYGHEGVATDEDVVRWHRRYGESMDDNILHALTVEEEKEDE